MPGPYRKQIGIIQRDWIPSIKQEWDAGIARVYCDPDILKEVEGNPNKAAWRYPYWSDVRPLLGGGIREPIAPIPLRPLLPIPTHPPNLKPAAPLPVVMTSKTTIYAGQEFKLSLGGYSVNVKRRLFDKASYGPGSDPTAFLKTVIQKLNENPDFNIVVIGELWSGPGGGSPSTVKGNDGFWQVDGIAVSPWDFVLAMSESVKKDLVLLGADPKRIQCERAKEFSVYKGMNSGVTIRFSK